MQGRGQKYSTRAFRSQKQPQKRSYQRNRGPRHLKGPRFLVVGGTTAGFRASGGGKGPGGSRSVAWSPLWKRETPTLSMLSPWANSFAVIPGRVILFASLRVEVNVAPALPIQNPGVADLDISRRIEPIAGKMRNSREAFGALGMPGQVVGPHGAGLRVDVIDLPEFFPIQETSPVQVVVLSRARN